MTMNFQCPGCGATLTYKEGTDILKCEYCDTEVSIQALKEREEEKTQEEQYSFDRQQVVREEEEQDFKAFHCSSCGAELLTDEYTAATFCSF